MARYDDTYYERYALQRRAYYEIREAIRKGILERGCCEEASEGCFGRVEAHHDDYAAPLDVRWLCARHHRQLHRALRTAA